MAMRRMCSMRWSYKQNSRGSVCCILFQRERISVMPPFVPFENVISLAHVCSLNGRIVEHLLHFKRDAGDPDLGTLASDISSARVSWKLSVMPLLSADARYITTIARLLTFSGAI